MSGRSRVVLDAFRSHHVTGRRPTGAYRRFMTFDEMRDQIRAQRRAGHIPPRSQGLSDEEWLKTWLQQQVALGVLRLGLWARCYECRAGSFLSLSSFADTFVCPRCGASAETPAVPRFGYQLAEVADLFFANDCDITALAVAALARRSQGGYSFDLDHTVAGPRRLRNELDFFAVIDGGLYVGESKKNGAFDANDISVLRRVALATRARAVVLATGTECDGGCGPHCVRDFRVRDASSDTSLPIGARARATDLRTALAPACDVIVLCRGDLHGPFRDAFATSRISAIPGPGRRR